MSNSGLPKAPHRELDQPRNTSIQSWLDAIPRRPAMTPFFRWQKGGGGPWGESGAGGKLVGSMTPPSTEEGGDG